MLICNPTMNENPASCNAFTFAADSMPASATTTMSDAPNGMTPAMTRWAARPDVPEVLAGEDRTFGEGLFVDLVPRTCWFTNVRSAVSAQD